MSGEKLDLAEVKKEVCEYIDSIAPDLVEISHAIHSKPELGYEEHCAHPMMRVLRVTLRSSFDRGTATKATRGCAHTPSSMAFIKS